MKFMEIHSNGVLSHWAVKQLDLLYIARQLSLPGKIQPESMLLKDFAKLLSFCLFLKSWHIMFA